MLLSKAWELYESYKRIEGFSTQTLNAYKLQSKLLIQHFNDVDIESLTTDQLKGYLAKSSEHLKPSSLAHRIRFIKSLFRWSHRPHRMSIGQMRYIIKRISSRAGMNKEIHPHQLRHSYATHLLNNGAPIDVIQSLLGHEKSETTRIYAQLSGNLRREFYKKYF